MSNHTDPAVPPPIRQLIEVFADHLADVEFPGVTAAALAEAADAVEQAASALEAAEAVVTEARRTHAEAYGSLKLAAERGLGYARVYARDDEPLLEAIEAIDLGEKSRRRKLAPKKKERRPRGTPTNVAELPLQAGAS